MRNSCVILMWAHHVVNQNLASRRNFTISVDIVYVLSDLTMQEGKMERKVASFPLRQMPGIV